jgi:ribosomal protein S18 acetylase RimI-like enzyme
METEMITLERNDTIHVSDAPAIPGLTFRHFRGESDFPNMLAVFDACKIIDQIEWAMSVEHLARFYAHLTNCDAYQDMLFVEVEGRVLGYTRVWWMKEDGDNRLYAHFGHVLPEWRRKGIGRAMLRWNEARLREIAAGHPHNTPRLFQAEVSDGEIAKEALLSSEGYAPVRHGYHMRRSLAEPITLTPLPPGLEVRPVPPQRYRTLWEADQEAFRDHWGFVPGTETDYQRWLNEPIFNPGLWQVAWDGDQIAGAVQNFVNEKENQEYNHQRGYTEGIFVRRPWRKRGLARALIMRSLLMFKDMGFTEAALGVDTQNLSGALRLYESCGFRAVKRESLYRKPM